MINQEKLDENDLKRVYHEDIDGENYPSLNKQQLREKLETVKKAAIKRATARLIPKRICENSVCQLKYRPLKKWQRFCSTGCRKMNWLENQKPNS